MDAVMYYKRGDHNYMIRSEKRPGLTARPPKNKKPGRLTTRRAFA